MISLVMTISGLIIGIILIASFHDDWDKDWLSFAGVGLVIVSVISLIIMIFSLIFKPVEYKNFKIEYDTIKQMETCSEDIRDTNYTLKIIELNTEINRNRAYLDSEWIGIFMNKKIADLELLKK